MAASILPSNQTLLKAQNRLNNLILGHCQPLLTDRSGRIKLPCSPQHIRQQGFIATLLI